MEFEKEVKNNSIEGLIGWLLDETVVDPVTGEVIAKRGDIITLAIAERIVSLPEMFLQVYLVY